VTEYEGNEQHADERGGRRAPLPIRLASRALTRVFLNPGGDPTDERLRGSVEGKVVLLTGASYGIGEASALRLGAAGATVLLVARSPERLEEVAERIEEGGGTARVHPCDLADPDAVEALGAAVLAENGRVDVLVSNAGKSIRRSIDLSYERFHDFRRTIDVNYLGPVRLVLALLPSMRERGEGHIVNVSTLGIRMPPTPRWSAYLSSKAAFDVWLRSLAPEVRGDGISCTSIYMSLVHTRMSEPTPMFRNMPGLTPEQAAGLVCRAIVERPREIEPWWVRGAAPALEAARGPWERGTSIVYNLTTDTPASGGPVGESGGGPGGADRPGAADALRGAAALAGLAPQAVEAMARSGMLSPARPDRVVRMLTAPLRHGMGPAALGAASAARWPDQPAIVDELGELTYEELDRRGRALAAGLRQQLGVTVGDGLALMCRNHRGFVEGLVAGSRLGADVLLLNTDFAGPQLAEVLEREGATAAILDEEFGPVFDEAGFEGPRALAWAGGGAPAPTVEGMVGAYDPDAAPDLATRAQGRLVILTSGTTGTPKGAPRSLSVFSLLGPMTTFLARVPVQARERILIGPPFFHGFGLTYLGLAMFLGATAVVRRRFDAEEALRAIDEHRITTLIAVPVMLQRILDLPPEVRERYDTSSLRVVISAAAPLGPNLAGALTDAFGDVVYNIYGTTETGFATIATPEDLRAAPGTVGRPMRGAALRLFDERGTEVRAGETGRVFIGGGMVFEGYSGGGSKATIAGMMGTGDLGHFDEEGRLFIDGREDDMIVSGGENVFPGEVEETLGRHPDVADVAVLGVEDERFGQRLLAYVVVREGAGVTEEDLKSHVKANLARFKVPREVVLVEEIPRNPTGKVLRRRLEADRSAQAASGS
jgi:acyl-CoA synthetase (AMP-forming)/AMP-acid ligase II/NAD(P)-dependent dehydrogenase (short-subunit alcohol dehydrogenase family)